MQTTILQTKWCISKGIITSVLNVSVFNFSKKICSFMFHTNIISSLYYLLYINYINNVLHEIISYMFTQRILKIITLCTVLVKKILHKKMLNNIWKLLPCLKTNALLSADYKFTCNLYPKFYIVTVQTDGDL